MKITLQDGARRQCLFGQSLHLHGKHPVAFEVYEADMQAARSMASLIQWIANEVLPHMVGPSVITPTHIPTYISLYGTPPPPNHSSP